MQFARYFRLADAQGFGIRCGKLGLFVGETPLLERPSTAGRRPEWRPRPLVEINRELGKAFGLPVDFKGKLGGLASVAGALQRGDVAHAQIAALLLQIPDPPKLSKSERKPKEIADLALQLRASGFLGGGGIEAEQRAGPSAQAIRAPGSLGKDNPYHDETGRFTDAESAVSAQTASGEDKPTSNPANSPPRNAAASTGTSKPAPRDSSIAELRRLSCADAFRACVQDAIFSRQRSTEACTAALRACRTTGLPTIFAPGIVGQQ